MSPVRRVDPPTDSRLAPSYAGANLADAFAIALSDNAPDDAMALARATLADPPWWFRALLAIRDAAVKPLGLKTSAAMRHHLDEIGVEHVDIFRVLSSTRDEAIFGEQDQHLDFKLSILIRRVDGPSAGSTRREAIATTVVNCHNRLGRFYLALILPGHVLVVRSHLKAAAKRFGRPAADSGA
ncbi:DUF2867 domain-containing protein [Roseateles sp. L2-2]|uniref:DUF2867 domain-containing protein n=1 Tax=Roseateles sp. L2-2 TaxID=3422597 RepID=UPI003D359E76